MSLTHRRRTSRCRLLAGWMLAFGSGALAAQSTEASLTSVRARLFENENLLFYVPEPGDGFAWSLATGDFDGDGAEDLATGIPFDDGLAGLGPFDCGAVVVRYGAPGRGLATGLADDVLNQLATATPDPADADDWFGYALAACDFNGDGFDDLVVGIPREDHLGQENAGAFQIHFGSPTGLPGAGAAFYTQSSPGMPGDVEEFDRFGEVLSCGDFDADGFADLAIGVPYESFGGSFDFAKGVATFVPGSAAGLAVASATSLDQDVGGMDGTAEPLDLFGDSLAVGDFNADGFADLAVGVPGETLDDDSSGDGAVHMLWGGPSGITAAGNFLFFENALGGAVEEGDFFGDSLAAGDFDGDGFDDLAIGVAREDLGAFVDTGNVGEVFGAAGGLDFARSQGFDQDRIYGAGQTESGDLFGFALAAGDFDRDGFDDLAIGHPGEFILGPAEGAVTAILGSAGFGLTTARRIFLAAGYVGIPGDPFPHKQFGHTLATGVFDGDGHADLAVGMPFAEDGPIVDAGAEVVLYGALFAEGFERGLDDLRWSSVVP